MTHTYLLIAVLPSSPVPYCTYLKSTQKNFWRRLYSYVLNSRVTEPNLTKFLQGFYNVYRNDCRLLCCDRPICLETPTWRIKIVIKLGANHGKTCAFQQRKLWDCWMEVHQIWTRCSLITAIEPFESGFTIGESILTLLFLFKNIIKPLEEMTSKNITNVVSTANVYSHTY